MKLWRKGYRKVIFGLFTASIILFPIYLHFLNEYDPTERAKNLNSAVTILFLFWGGLAAVWTARETFDQKQIANKTIKEIRKQNDYEMRPYLRLQWSDSDAILELVNVGRGIALDVKFERIDFPNAASVLTPIQIKSRPLISPKGKTDITREEFFDSYSPFLKNQDLKTFLEKKIEYGYVIKCTYDDLVGNQYRVGFVSDDTYNDRFRIDYQEKLP